VEVHMQRSMKVVIVSHLLACCTLAGAASAQESEPGVHLIANTKVSSLLAASGQQVRISGRASFHLSASEALLKDGVVQVSGFNLAYFDVPQQLLAGDRAAPESTGVLGFAAKSAEPQRLTYDPGSGRITGEIRGYVDAAYMAALAQSQPDEKGDLVDTPTQPATLSLELQLAELLQTDVKEVRHVKGELSVKFTAEPVRAEQFQLLPFAVVFDPRVVSIEVELGPWFIFEAAKSLCVQPVRIGRLEVKNAFPPVFSFELTGDGLAFGQPGANTEWAKDDVVFDYRGWKTVWKPGFWVVDTSGGGTSAEQSDVLDEVNDDDCIEVYFIDEFNPVSWGGGGATWGSGTAGAKIISSDANAAGGIDLTHLAHELGHVLGLRHPGDLPTASATPGSSGTLMCPSGFLNDNPQINSQENKNSLSNPLLVFSLKVKSPGPDCQNSATCGACP
jgi:hypothetical protein